MEPIVVHVQLTPEDYIAASRLHQRAGTWAGRHFLFVVVVWLLLVGFGVLVLSQTGEWVILAAAIGGAVGWAWSWYYQLPVRCRRIFRQQKALQRPYTMEFAEAGMKFSSEGTSSSRPWSEFHKWVEGPEQFLLYYSDLMFNLIPKRFVSEQPAFRELLAVRIPPRM